MAKFRPNLGQIWPKMAIFEFSQKIRKHHFFRLKRLGLVQKISKFWRTDWEKNAKNLHFWSFWAKKANFGQFLAKMAKMVKMIKKALGTFFLTFWTLTSYKISEKSDERFMRKSVADARTNVRTHERTDATPKVSNDRWSRDQKVRKTSMLGISIFSKCGERGVVRVVIRENRTPFIFS